MRCLNRWAYHSFAGSLTCQRCGAADTSFRPTELQMAELRGRTDCKRGKSRNDVPYATPDRAEAWERGWDKQWQKR